MHSNPTIPTAAIEPDRLRETERLRPFAQSDVHDQREDGDVPRPVTRGERYSGAAAHIDWLACTFRVADAQLFEVVEALGCLPLSSWSERAGGWQGYAKRVNLGDFGLLAYGGEHQRGTAHIELNAHGCAAVSEWHAVHAWCQAHAARITRIDLAHDDFIGEHVTIAKALSWLADGSFTAGGRAPLARLIDDLGSNQGKTLYVGQRKSGKLCRIYEKGKQLGDPQSPWCRVEVELRGKSREIPHGVLLSPGTYLAGAYPCLANLSTHQDKLRTLSAEAEITYARMVENLHRQYGPALNVMLQVEQGDPFAVLAQAARPGVPKRLAHCPVPRGSHSRSN